MLNIVRSFIRAANSRCLATAVTPAASGTIEKSLANQAEAKYVQRREVWIDSLESDNKVGILELNSKVFAATPRMDIIHQNVEWQRKYRYVSFAHSKIRMEMRGGGRKPWPQKGLGRARHGSIRSPLFVKGGRAHGPRSPTTHFFMLPFFTRVHGLTSTLSAKLAQGDLHVVKDLEIPTEESGYIKELIERRNWGPSVLIVDDTDFVPQNIALATEEIPYVTIMPVYGLNVYSMLKYATLVLTEAAVKRIEERITFQFNRIDGNRLTEKFKLSQRN